MDTKFYIYFTAGLFLTSPAFAQSKITKEQCDAIIKCGKSECGSTQSAIRICMDKFYPSVIPNADDGSSTNNEKDDELSIIKGVDGQLYSIHRLNQDVEIPDSINTNGLDSIAFTDKNKLDVQILEQKTMQLKERNVSPNE